MAVTRTKPNLKTVKVTAQPSASNLTDRTEKSVTLSAAPWEKDQ